MAHRMTSRMRLAAALLGCAACSPSASGANAVTAVTAVRFWSLGDTTRVVIETLDEFEYRWDRVPSPERVFFDIIDARMRLGGRRLHTIHVGDRLLKQIRVAETQPGVTRVVFDVEPEVQHSASQLTNPNRLIVELRPSAAMAVVPPVEPRMVSAPPLPKQTPRIDTAPDPTRLRDRIAAAPAPPKPAKMGSDSRSLTRVLGLKVARIVIDAGHGGADTGTSGPRGLLEKDLVLDVAKRLGELVRTRMGAEVIYTRTDDTYVPLEARTQMANDRKADLFLSIHANSSSSESSSGVETYYLNLTTSKEALELAARENAGSQKTVYELQDLLHSIALQDKIDESRAFAGKIQTALYSASARANSRSRNRGVKKAPFVVLIGATMPSVLAEIGFVSNPRDEVLFGRSEVRQRLAEGLFRGISQYAETLSRFEVAQK
jgi:N-acetylmuramoyl-L-alanine amidase